MARKTPEILRPVGGVYRVPTRKVFKKIREDKGATWDEVYGNKKCLKCKKNFREGDAYVVIVQSKKSNGHEAPVHKYQHVECVK